MLSLPQLVQLITTGRFAILAGADIIRNGRPYSLASMLRDGSYSAVYAMRGLWNGETEMSYLVANMDAIAAKQYGRTFDQTCVMTQDAMYYMDGTIVPLDVSRTKFGNDDSPEYSEIETTSGPIRFVIPGRDMSAYTLKERAKLWGTLVADNRGLPIH